MAHPKKGTPEAKAWAAKMQAARKKAGYRRGPNKCMRRNANGDYTGVLKLPFYIERAVAMVLHDGPRVLDWEWDRKMSPENKKHFHDFLVSVHHPLAYEGMTPEQRYKRFILDYVMSRIEKNPGQAWHEGMEHVAARYSRSAREPLERAMFKGIEVAHRDSAKAARRLHMNRATERVIRPKHRQNPLAVFGAGNPPKRVSVSVAGVLYSRCLEIRAEKVKYQPGLYKHPFTRKAGVQILALDSGDLLVHSTRGMNLWEPI